jgi:predicted acetyltransferase
MKIINYKIIKKINNLELNNFLKKISGRHFKKNKNIKNAPWKYLKQKNIESFFLKINKNIIGVIVLINFKFSKHLSFLYILKKFRKKNLGSILFNRYFLNTRKIKTIHVIKSLEKTLSFYKRKGFIINKNFNNHIIKKWILRCQKFNKETFEKRYLLYNVNNAKVLLPK